MNVAIIPARGGSKRIPGKNIRPFCGRPMISYPIEAALAAGRFERVIVSTDCPQVAEVALTHGAEVPFTRPAELSNDVAPTMPVIRHALEWLRESGCVVDLAFCIYATAPFVLPSDLRIAVDQLDSNLPLDFVLAVSEFKSAPQRAMIEMNGLLKFAEPENALKRSQDLPDSFHDAGLFFGGQADKVLNCETTVDGNCAAIRIPRDRAQDIDTEDDWKFAERLYQLMQVETPDALCQK